MRAYLATTASIFGFLVVLHVWRLLAAEPGLARDPWYWLITGLAAVLCVWACSLLLRTRARP